MMLLAITTLLSFNPLVTSHRLSKSRITVTKNRFSCHYKKKKQSVEYQKNMNLYKRLIYVTQKYIYKILLIYCC
jgi:ethanolamine utilization protein EutP (predicted NTPase)